MGYYEWVSCVKTCSNLIIQTYSPKAMKLKVGLANGVLQDTLLQLHTAP